MGLFSRRRTQDALDSIGNYISPKKRQSLIKELDEGAYKTLAAEWELVVIDSFFRSIDIEIEKSHGGSSLVDMTVLNICPSHASTLIDITTLTNEEIETLNPIETFDNKINSAFKKFGIPASGILLDVGYKILPERKNVFVLSIPHQSEMDDFIKKHIHPMLEEIVRANKSAFRRIKDGSTEVFISWDPAEKFNSTRHGGYDRSIYAYRNTLMNRLGEKRKQIKKSGHCGIGGIIVCDGGSSLFDLLRNKSPGYDIIKDVREFLRKTDTIGFVTFVFVSGSKIKSETIFSENLSTHFIEPFSELMIQAISRMPPPLMDARNTISFMKRAGGNRPQLLYGKAVSWGKNSEGREKITIKVPASSAVALLGGEITFERFALDAGLEWYKPGETSGNAIMGGSPKLTLSDVRLERTERDDDWLVFSFVGDDPSTNEFR